MKKFLLMMLMLIGFTLTSFAQVQWYRTTAYAQARVYNGRYNWGSWESSDMRVCINLNTDMITIYSPKTQVYKVIGNAQRVPDDSGQSIKFYVVDQDGDRGYIRLRIENNGNSQLYVDYNNISWCYVLVRTS